MLKSAKFAPRLRARAIWKSKLLKTEGARALLDVEVGKICATPARESDLEVKIVKNCGCESTFGCWSRQNLHHACARERFGSQNRLKLRVREHFWKLKSPKFAPRLRARTIWKSKSLKTEGARALLDVEVGKICTTPARENDLEVKIVKTPRSRTTFWGSNCWSVDNQIIWISNRLTTKSFGSQIISQPISLNLKSSDYQTSCPWISNQFISQPFESQSIDSQNHLSQTSEDNPAVWISNQFTTQPFEFQIRWQPNPWNFKSTAISNRLTNKSLQSHNNWQPTHLNLKERWTNKPQIKWHSKSVRNQATWSDINWFSHQRHAPSSYRFFMVGNFRHRLARSICYNCKRFN